MKKTYLFIFFNLIVVYGFSQHLFPANHNQEGKSGFIDENGKTVLPFIYDVAGDFSEGLAYVRIGEEGNFINKNGDVIIRGTFRSSEGFKYGVAKVLTEKYSSAIINKKGEIIIENLSPYDEFYDGMMKKKIKNKIGYYNTSGKLVIPAIYKKGTNFSEGLAGVMHQDDTYCFIDKTGKTAFKINFAPVASFSEGLAQVSEDNQTGYINKKGELVIGWNTSSYSFYNSPYKDGMARFSEDDKWGFINTKGKKVINAKYYEAKNFSQGNVAVAKNPNTHKVNREWGYINKNGKELTAFKYIKAFPYTENRAVASWYDKEQKKYFYDLLDKNGKTIKKIDAREGMTIKGFQNGLCLIYTRVYPAADIKAPVDSLTLTYLKEWGGCRFSYINTSGDIVWQSAPYYVCFPTDAKVTLANGAQKSLDKIKGNELLLSFDPVTNSFITTKIKKKQVHTGHFELIKIGYIPVNEKYTASIAANFNQIKYLLATPSHPVLTTNGILRMKDIKIGNKIYFSQNNQQAAYAEVISINPISKPVKKVINLKTEKENYIINGVVVMRK